jgi:hypothetical protein
MNAKQQLLLVIANLDESTCEKLLDYLEAKDIKEDKSITIKNLITKSDAIEYLRRRGFIIGYEESYPITEKALIDFMVEFCNDQLIKLNT